MVRFLCAAALAATPAAGQAVEPAAPVTGARNAFPNPSFEEGRDPWWSFAERGSPSWYDFEVTDERAHSGQQAALLDLTSEGPHESTRIYGAIQEVATPTVPDRLSGWYYVEDWARGSSKQYVQVVVIVWNARRLPEGVKGARNYQIAYTLAGVEEAPLDITNRKFVVHRPGDSPLIAPSAEPVEDRWVHFEFDLRDDFRRLWGLDPRGYECLRILFEVRYDDRTQDDPPARARVFYDDLYLGPRPPSPLSPGPGAPEPPAPRAATDEAAPRATARADRGG